MLQLQNENFPLVDLDCNELEHKSFYSLYSCKCFKNTDFTTDKDKNVFHYTPTNHREHGKAS